MTKGPIMKLKQIVTFTAALMLTASMARAVHVWEDPGGWWSGAITYNAETPRYTANELSLDAFGSYTAGEHHLSKLFETDIKGNRGRWGGGVGLNYFLTRELGFGGDINITDKEGGNFVDQALGSLILRWPFDPSGFAPYIFGGGGRGFDPA